MKTLARLNLLARMPQARETLYPLLTLRMGIACHQGTIEVCEGFEHRLALSGALHS